MDANDSGTISKEEFESTLQDERVQAYFNAMKLDARSRAALRCGFHLLLPTETVNSSVPTQEKWSICLHFSTSMGQACPSTCQKA